MKRTNATIAAKPVSQETAQKIPWPDFLFFVSLFGIVLALYYQILDNPLLFDSATTLNENFLNNSPHSFSLQFHRFFSYNTFFIFYRIFGKSMWEQNLLNIFFHFANGVLMFYFYRVLFAVFLSNGAEPRYRFWLPAAAALIFMLHPISVYATAYLIQRTILMAVFFSLIALIFYVLALSRGHPLFYVGSILGFFFAAYSKEHTVLLPGVMGLLLVMAYRQGRLKFQEPPLPTNGKPPWSTVLLETGWPYVFFALVMYFISQGRDDVIGLIYEPHGQAITRLLTEKDLGVTENNALLLSQITQGFMYFRYLFVWLVPLPQFLSIDVHVPFPMTWYSLPELPGFIAFVLLFLGLAYLLYRSKGETALLAFGLLSPMILFLLEFTTVRMAEQFVLYRSYLWVITLFAALPWVFQRVEFKFKKSAGLILGIFAVIYVLLLIPTTNGRIDTFESRHSIWEDTIQKIHGDETSMIKTYRTYNNYGHALTLEGDMAKAITYFLKSVQINPYYTKAWSNLGAAYVALGGSSELTPEQTQDYYNKAQSAFQKALETEPHFPDALIGLGVVFANQGLFEESLDYYNQAARADPKNSNIYYNSGNSYLHLGRLNEAKVLYNKALELNPGLTEAFYNLALVDQRLGQYGEAEKHLKQALNTNPAFLEGRASLAGIYRQFNRVNEAEEEENRIRAIDPSFFQRQQSGNTFKNVRIQSNN